MGERGTRKVELPPELNTELRSNAIYLSGRQWAGVGLFAVLFIAAAPALWKHVEPFALEPDYRVPHDLSNDYWLYDRYASLAAAQGATLLVGDSVIWGEYVTRQQTLAHYLNEQAGRQQFANLGLDGAHPAALAGLIEFYATGVTDRNVLLQCNPLWMSEGHDLRGPDEPLHHPQLVPQFVPKIPPLKEQASTRIGTAIERHIPFSAWTDHLQQAYFDHANIPTWTLEHPYANPLAPFAQGLPPSDNQLRHEPISWKARGVKPQAFPWVDLDESLQWHSFQRAVHILRQRGNRVFVLVGPFNEHLLNAGSREAYQGVKGTIAAWLEQEQVPHLVPKPLPSELYADASHPLAAGYAKLARECFPHLQAASR